MPDRPPDNPESPTDPARTLNDILAALSRVGEDEPHAPAQEAANPVQGAVSELSAALDQLFALVRSERSEQRARITELEAALSAAHARIRQLEAGEVLDDIPAPPPNDFGQLREAAERLRRRTEELFREAGPVSQEQAPGDGLRIEPDQTDRADRSEPPEESESESEARIRAARDSVESSIADDHAAAAGEGAAPPQQEFAKPGVLRIFPGASGPADDDGFDVESDLALEEPETFDEPEVIDELPSLDEEPEVAEGIAVAVPVPTDPAPELVDEAEAVDEAASPPASTTPATASAPAAQPERPEPIEIAPRPARKRRAGLRRRRIDARKLAGVDPATALRAMVSAIDDIWTTGVTLDLVIALTDGGSLKVSGGHNRPLTVAAVEAGTSARTTVTATTAQLVPLFGRLDLGDDQSPPLVHGPRRDADLLVGWIDRAQRLEAEPL